MIKDLTCGWQWDIYQVVVVPNIDVTIFGDDVLSEEKSNKNKMLNQYISERTYPSEAVLWSLFLISPFLRTHTRKRCPLTRVRRSASTEWCFQVHLQKSFFLSSWLIYHFSPIRLHTMNTYKVRWTARGWWAKRTTAFTSCHNDKIILYTLVVHHCPFFQNRRKRKLAH